MLAADQGEEIVYYAGSLKPLDSPALLMGTSILRRQMGVEGSNGGYVLFQWPNLGTNSAVDTIRAAQDPWSP